MIIKLVIFNFTALCALLAATWAGFVIPAFQADISYVSYGIVAMFLYGSAQIAYHAAGYVKDHQLTYFAHVNDICGYLVYLGLIGTAIGVLIALDSASVDVSASGLKEFTGQVLEGVKVAFHATIVGSIAWMWHHINTRMVYTNYKVQGYAE